MHVFQNYGLFERRYMKNYSTRTRVVNETFSRRHMAALMNVCRKICVVTVQDPSQEGTDSLLYSF